MASGMRRAGRRAQGQEDRRITKRGSEMVYFVLAHESKKGRQTKESRTKCVAFATMMLACLLYR